MPTFLPIVYVLAFIAVVMGVQAVVELVLNSRDRNRRVNRRLTMLDSGMAPEDVYAALIRRAPNSSASGSIFRNAYERLVALCRQSGLKLTPMRLFAFVAGAAGAPWLATMSFLNGGRGGGNVVMNAVTSLVAAILLAAIAGWAWLQYRRNARLKKLEEQLPLALDVVVRAIRAGHPVVSAVQLAAEELGDPLGSEFGLIVDEYTYGSEFKETLLNFARRTGSSDAHFFAVSVGIQAETGGNLAEILDGLSSVIRARRTLGKKVKALASEGRASAWVLSGLPLFLISFLMLTQPSYYMEKFGDPLFWTIAGGVLSLYVTGWVSIQRIVNFKY